MLAALLLVLQLFGQCLALGNLIRVYPPGRNGLSTRQILEGVESGFKNSTTNNASIVSLSISEDRQSYYTVIKAGSASFRVALDTASADLWLVSSACTSGACSALPKYPLAYQSPTFQSVNLNQTLFNVSFADGTAANGFVARETIALGNLTGSAQAFGLINSTNVTTGDQISGILGLGFPRLSQISSAVVNGTPFFANMAQYGQLDYPLFALSLTNDSSGSLAFGAVDGSVVQNSTLIEWNEVVPFAPFKAESTSASYLQWTIILSSISVNGTASVIPQPTYSNINRFSLALLDVGTNGLFGPYQDVTRLFSLIEGSRLVDEGQWALPCDSNVTISFQFGGRNFTMEPSDYLIGPVESNPDLCLSWPRALPPSSDGIDWQFGSNFLRTVYSIFSFGINTKEPPMIGLYPLRNSSAPVETYDEVLSSFSLASETVATTLPNFPLSTPSFTTPPFAFNTSVRAPPGAIVSSGLATSTYSAVLGTHHANLSIPTVTPSPTLVTFLLTDAAGHTSTSVSTAPVQTVTLGAPPGWNSAAPAMSRPIVPALSALLVVTLSLLL